MVEIVTRVLKRWKIIETSDWFFRKPYQFSSNIGKYKSKRLHLVSYGYDLFRSRQKSPVFAVNWELHHLFLNYALQAVTVLSWNNLRVVEYLQWLHLWALACFWCLNIRLGFVWQFDWVEVGRVFVFSRDSGVFLVQAYIVEGGDVVAGWF